MQIIILFVLAGLSLATENGCYVPPEGGPLINPECLKTALTRFPVFTKHLAFFICGYKGKIEYSQEELEATIRELIVILKCAGCPLFGIEYFEDGDSLDVILAVLGKSLYEVSEELFHVLDALAVSEGGTDLLCKLTKKALLSDCLWKLTAVDLAKLPEDLKQLICKGDRNAITAKQVITILKDITCLAGDALGIDDKWLDELLEHLGDEGLKDLLKEVIDVLVKLLGPGGLFHGVVCPLFGG
ncbi:ranaspumin-like [Engystomops pustulosus]|uniref:ranaspumin-like n=1 Tax=Engystomops pustulosus TaxID=76066 RepID=UPI003AFB45D4